MRAKGQKGIIRFRDFKKHRTVRVFVLAIVDVKTLGATLNRAERYGYIDRNPVKAVTLPKCVSTEREVFSLEEIHNVLVKGKGTRSFARRTFHSLRHTFTSMLAGHGVSEELRLRLTGHSSRDIPSATPTTPPRRSKRPSMPSRRRRADLGINL